MAAREDSTRALTMLTGSPAEPVRTFMERMAPSTLSWWVIDGFGLPHLLSRSVGPCEVRVNTVRTPANHLAADILEHLDIVRECYDLRWADEGEIQRPCKEDLCTRRDWPEPFCHPRPIVTHGQTCTACGQDSQGWEDEGRQSAVLQAPSPSSCPACMSANCCSGYDPHRASALRLRVGSTSSRCSAVQMLLYRQRC